MSTVSALRRRLDAFLFAPFAATGLGVLRALWAAACLMFFLGVLPHAATLFGPDGLQPSDRVTVSQFWVSYAALLLSLACALVGIWPRWSTILSFLLVLAFHGRNPHAFTAGDGLLRQIGFLLCIAPGIDAFSLARARRQALRFRRHRALLPARTMPAWPYRLLLWTMILFAARALWAMLPGTAWTHGTAAAIVLWHPFHARFPGTVELLASFSRPITLSVPIALVAWIALLIPHPLPILRRVALVLTALLALGAWLFLAIGTLPLALLAACCGLLRESDRAALRDLLNAKIAGPIVVLYDGECGLCRSVAGLWLTGDWLRRVTAADFRDAGARARFAADLDPAALERAIHIRFPAMGATPARTLSGFDAIRALCRHLPPFWPLFPLLFVPGIPRLGRRIYAWIAANRGCQCGACAI